MAWAVSAQNHQCWSKLKHVLFTVLMCARGENSGLPALQNEMVFHVIGILVYSNHHSYQQNNPAVAKIS
jgi:hypothetical protein